MPRPEHSVNINSINQCIYQLFIVKISRYPAGIVQMPLSLHKKQFVCYFLHIVWLSFSFIFFVFHKLHYFLHHGRHLFQHVQNSHYLFYNSETKEERVSSAVEMILSYEII